MKGNETWEDVSDEVVWSTSQSWKQTHIGVGATVNWKMELSVSNP